MVEVPNNVAVEKNSCAGPGRDGPAWTGTRPWSPGWRRISERRAGTASTSCRRSTASSTTRTAATQTRPGRDYRRAARDAMDLARLVDRWVRWPLGSRLRRQGQHREYVSMLAAGGAICPQKANASRLSIGPAERRAGRSGSLQTITPLPVDRSAHERDTDARRPLSQRLCQPVLGIPAVVESGHLLVAEGRIQPAGFDQVVAGVQAQH